MDEQVATHNGDPSPEAPASGKMLSERRQLWRAPAMMTLALIVVVFAIYWQTSWSIVSIWIRSETYAHGFLILPISAYLVWKRRVELLWIDPKPNWFGIPIILVLGLGWLVAHLASVLVIEQLAMMAMVPTIVWALLGWQVTRIILFPLFFLFFAVPMGEDLVPPLMDFTANFAVWSLKLTGIPVFHEGTFFEIPGSRWSVIEACSGIRYLIASVTLGCLYAYLSYRSLGRRLLFIVSSVIVPVFANGLRAYMIVMIAYLSDMRLATGIDHIIYGWLFFGLVMVLLFWLGSFWREEIQDINVVPIQAKRISIGLSSFPKYKSIILITVSTLIVLGVWPFMAKYMTEEVGDLTKVELAIPAPQSGWKDSLKAISSWQPHYTGMDGVVNHSYHYEKQRVNVYLAYYRSQHQGAELINSDNVLVPQKDPIWQQTADLPYEVKMNGKRLSVRLAKIQSENQSLLVWYWFWVDGHTTTNHYLTKLWDAKAKLLGRPGDAAVIVISTPLNDQLDDAESVLRKFMVAMRTSINRSLENAKSD